MIKHMIIQVFHKSIKYLKQATTKNKQERPKVTLSLEAYDLYIFSPFGNKLPQSS